MGKITLTVEGTTVGTVAGGGGLVLPFEVSEIDSARLVTAMADFYSGALARGGRGATNDVTPEPPTIPDIIRAWFADVIATALRLTADYEKRQTPVAAIVVTES